MTFPNFNDNIAKSEVIQIIKNSAEEIKTIETGSRNLKNEEREELIKNGNYSHDWENIKIYGNLNFEQVRNNIILFSVTRLFVSGSYISQIGRSTSHAQKLTEGVWIGLTCSQSINTAQFMFILLVVGHWLYTVQYMYCEM